MEAMESVHRSELISPLWMGSSVVHRVFPCQPCAPSRVDAPTHCQV